VRHSGNEMKKRTIILLSMILVTILIGGYFAGELLLQSYIDSGAKSLLKLEKQGKLSREYGYVWQEINANNEMKRAENSIANGNSFITDAKISDSKGTINFPSLAAVRELNSIKSLHKTIRINDRNGIVLAQLQTTHTSIKLSELNDILLKTLLTTEDKHYYNRDKAYDYKALFRATIRAAFTSLTTLSLRYPRGSSTIHMQVARFLLMKYDRRGYAYAEKSITRKANELKLSEALSELYTKDEILTFYVNHCVTAGKGMLGYHDISMGLFGITPDKLSIPQCLYLARLVKWNRQVPKKIIHQIKISMPALARLFNWTPSEQLSISESLDTLTFKQISPILPQNSYLIDLANQYWRQICQTNGMNESELAEMDLADQESMIRKYGNCTITLTIDYRLQRLLENIVKVRGFGSDTTIRTDKKIGSFGSDYKKVNLPLDTLRKLWIVKHDTLFKPSPAEAVTKLKKDDTVVCNIRYKRVTRDSVHRSCFYYKRDTLHVPGQYYAYSLMDSKTHKLLAYCSKDKLGSRLQSLLVNKTPNGSSVAKPLIYAISYDLGMYKPTDMTSDDQEVTDSSLWARSIIYYKKNPVGMNYLHVPQSGGYQVHNHNDAFDGYDFLYNHLANSNNIVAVETMYRLTEFLSRKNNRDKNLKNLVDRLGIRSLQDLPNLSGPQLYCALASVVNSSNIDNNEYSSNYSTALGTLELSLYEQMHLFNALFDNTLTIAPAKHPSLFVKSIQLAGSNIMFSDSISTCTIFSDLKNVRPVHLALHKRLISNPFDSLYQYDICDDGNSNYLSNFGKSGTTDDVIRPFNADITDTTKTNYGLWNAVMRLQLKRDDLRRTVANDTMIKKIKGLHIAYDSVPEVEMLDVTLASIGECNKQFTGERDGKTLHGYVSRELLHAFGVPCTTGIYADYDEELQRETSDRKKYASNDESDLSFFSKALIKLKSGLGSKAAVDEIRFDEGPKLKGKSYRRMLKFGQYMGENSRYYCDLLDKLKDPGSPERAEAIIAKITEIHPGNQILKRDIDRACTSLLESLKEK
jgi:hypothetical protein